MTSRNGRRGVEQRRRARLRGGHAETLAAWWLRLKGYRILAHGWRVPAGEIDLIARRGRTIAFVEVKARPDANQAAEAIRQRQMRRIARAAEAWLARHETPAGAVLRFDAVLLSPGRRPRHVIDAWREPR